MNSSSEIRKIHVSPFSRQKYDLNDLINILNPKLNHGLCGSQNLGNTCFMNSSIACISNCSELTYYFLSKKFLKDINKSNRDGAGGKLAMAWYDLIYYYWNSNHRYGNPHSIKSIVASKNRKFSGYQQQDSNEFMTVFLEILGEDLNKANKKVYRELKEQQKGESDVDAAQRFWKLHIQRNDNIITDLFHGLLKSTITCPKCKFKSITYDPFNTITLTIPSERIVNYLIQKNERKPKEKKIKKIKKKKKKEKEIVSIFYVYPYSLRMTVRYEIEIYKYSSLNDIANEIRKRSENKDFILNSKFMSVSNRECDYFLDEQLPFKKNNFTFAYANDSINKNQICIPIYLTDGEMISSYPRVIFLNKNDTYYELKKKIYILARKYLKSPFSEENEKEAYIEDKKLDNYINYKSDNLQEITNLLNNEFNNLQKSWKNLKNYIKNIPYQILLSNKFQLINKKHIINEGMVDNFDILSEVAIRSNNDKIETLVGHLLNKSLFLSVKFKKSSIYIKSFASFNNCTHEKCSPLKGEEYTTYYEEMEIEEDSEENENENRYYSNHINLDHCLQYFTEEECLEEGNEWYCDKCKRRVMASKKIELFYLPRILCICLTRFLKSGRYFGYTKNDELVEFPLENLNMSKYMCGPDKNYSKYDLFAVSQHYGGMGGGHYTAVCKNIDGKWYEYDDSDCSPVSQNQVITNAAYVLFYRRKGW